MTSTAMTVRFSRALALDTGNEELSPSLITIVMTGLGVATASSFLVSPHTGLSGSDRRPPSVLNAAGYEDGHINNAMTFRSRAAAQTLVATATSSKQHRGLQQRTAEITPPDSWIGHPSRRIEPAPDKHRRDPGERHSSIRAVSHSDRNEQASHQGGRRPVIEKILSSSSALPKTTARSADFDLMDRLARPRTILAEAGDADGSRLAPATAILARPQAQDDVAVEQQTDPDPISDDQIDRQPVDADAAEMAAIGKPYQAGSGVGFDVTTRVNGRDVGRLTLFVAGADLGHPEAVKTNISVNLGDILTLLKTKMSQQLYDDLTSSTAAQQYATLNDLRAHGIVVSFDHHDRLSLKLA